MRRILVNDMLAVSLISLGTATLLFCGYYLWAVHTNRRKGLETLRWVDLALGGNGHVTGICWLAPSRFQLPLRLSNSMFQHASVLVQLAPREMPIQWLWSRVKKQEPSLVFQADIDVAPHFSLELHTNRWFGRTSKKLKLDSNHWDFESVRPFVIMSRPDWQREIMAVLNAVISSEQRDFVSVSFSKRSPHFTATIPLDALGPGSQSSRYVFDMLRNLAAGASAKSAS